MKIAYICMDPGVPVFGRKGCSIHVQEVTRALLRQGMEVDMFTCRLGGKIPDGLKGLRVHKLPISKCEPAEREQLSIAANESLLSTLNYHGPFELIYERYSIWSNGGVRYALENSIPSILEVNAPLIEEQAKHRELVDCSTAQKIATQVFGSATILVAVSQEVSEYLNKYSGVSKKTHIVPNGVNPDFFPECTKSSHSASPNIFTVGFVGTLKPWHDVKTLLKGFTRLNIKYPDTRLLIVGDGPGMEQLEKHVACNNMVDVVEFTGAVSASEIPGLLASMDVAVAPYPIMEHFYFSPLKVFEYMAAGLPVVATKVGQLKELIQDGKNGILVPPEDPQAMAEALDRLRQEPDLRNQLGQTAREKVLRYHTWDVLIKRILSLCATRVMDNLRCGERV